MTRRLEVTFAVKEGGAGPTPFLALELLRGDPIAELERKFISFDLVPGITLEEDHELAKLLRSKIRSLALTP